MDLAGRLSIPARFGDVDHAGCIHDHVVAPPALHERRRLLRRVPGEDRGVAATGRHEPAVGSEALSITLVRIGEPDFWLPVGRDAVGLPIAHVVEEEFALGVGRGALGELVALADEPPVLARNENLLKLRTAQSGGHWLRPATPQPCKRLRKQLRGVLAVVATVAPRMPHVIPGEFQRPLHCLIGHPPVASVDVEVVRAVLQEYPQRLRLELADERRIGMAPPQADIRADAAVDP